MNRATDCLCTLRAVSPPMLLLAALLVALLAALLSAVPVYAQSQSAGERALRLFYNQTRQYHGAFEQSILDENLQSIENSTGLVWLARPGRFRWDYREPVSQLIVSDGDKLWVYDRDLAQITIRNAHKALGGSPASLLSGKGDLDANYNIRNLRRSQGQSWVSLTPKTSNGGGDYREFRFGFKRNELRTLELIDALSQTTRLTFSPRPNAKNQSQVFRLEPPPGVDVLDESGE